MYRLLPFLFMLALIPDSEKHMESLNAIVAATRESVASIKNGIDAFHTSMMPFMVAQPGEKTGEKTD